MSADKAIVSGVAGRYAVALFDLALENKALEQVEKDFGALEALLVESKDLAALVSSPLISRDDQAKAILAVADQAGAHALTRNTLGVLARNRRLASLPAVIADLKKLAAAHRGEVTAEVTSAVKLSAADLKALKEKLKAVIGKDVAVDAHVDAGLLGGLVVKVGSRMIDSSLKTKLDNLQVAMKGIA